MGEEIQGGEEDTGWRKAIPESRDRFQSRVLVGVVGTLMFLEAFSILRQACHLWDTGKTDELPPIATIIGISIVFALLVFALRAATLAGALSGGVICLILLSGTSSPQYTVMRSGLTPLALLFVFTFLSTRSGRRKKTEAGLAEARKGRSAAQVIANLATAALSVSSLGLVLVTHDQVFSGNMYDKIWIYPATMLMCIAALVEATADTVSSEIGQAFGGVPVMMVGFRRVAPGTDGAVTLVGSCAGIAAGGVVALGGAWAMHLSATVMLIGLGAGIFGLFFDSLLGATVERRGWMGNDLVNFTSTLFAALLALVAYRLFALL